MEQELKTPSKDILLKLLFLVVRAFGRFQGWRIPWRVFIISLSLIWLAS
jgi:hypothetical protein